MVVKLTMTKLFLSNVPANNLLGCSRSLVACAADPSLWPASCMDRGEHRKTLRLRAELSCEISSRIVPLFRRCERASLSWERLPQRSPLPVGAPRKRYALHRRSRLVARQPLTDSEDPPIYIER